MICAVHKEDIVREIDNCLSSGYSILISKSEVEDEYLLEWRKENLVWKK